MPKMHPHAEAAYQAQSCDDGTFRVEVSIPDSHPTKVSPFATQEDAEAWIANHRRRIHEQTQSSRWGRRSAET
jgi:hypothetical protein